MRKSGKPDDNVDELFKLPLTEFIDARNALAKQLKQSGNANDANLVKALAKPSVSAWTVNQLYWKHRDAFDRLLAAGQRFHRAQTSGKVADMRMSLDERRDVLAHLSDLATSLLRDAGHNPTLDAIRRINGTLEAMSALASLSDGPTPGRLSQDVNPPGFELFASFIPGAATMLGTRDPTSHKLSTVTKRRQKARTSDNVRQLEETRQARIAAVRVSLQAAKKALARAQARAQSLESAQRNLYAKAEQAEKQLRDAEKRFIKARAESEAATQRSQSVTGEAQEAMKAVEDARRTVEKATKELESLFSGLPAR